MKQKIFRVLFIFLFPCLSITVNCQERDLEYYISRGMTGSPLLNDLRNQIHSTSLDSLLINASKKPQVEGRSQLLYSPYSNTRNIGYDDVITDGGNYQAVAYVSQDIFIKKKTENQYRALSNEKLGINLSVKLSAAGLKKSITDLYIESYSVYSEMLFNISFLNLMKDENQIIKRFADDGVCAQSDYMSLLVESSGQEVIISQLRNLYRNDIMALNELCGIVDTTSVKLISPAIEQSIVPMKHDFLFLKQYYIDSLGIVNEKEALALRYMPSVNWFADAGILTSNPFNFYRHVGASAGVSLTVPIFDGHRRRIEEDKLTLKENTRLNYLDVSRRQYDQNLLRLCNELEGLNQVRSKLENQLNLSGELLKSLKVQMEGGIIKIQDYITSIKNYRNIKHNITIAEIDILRVKNELNYILSK